eukprot:1017293-Amphidinium_carterae.1
MPSGTPEPCGPLSCKRFPPVCNASASSVELPPSQERQPMVSLASYQSSVNTRLPDTLRVSSPPAVDTAPVVSHSLPATTSRYALQHAKKEQILVKRRISLVGSRLASEERRLLWERVEEQVEREVTSYQRRAVEEELEALHDRQKWLSERILLAQRSAQAGDKVELLIRNALRL